MIIIKNKVSLAKMKEAGRILASIFDRMPSIIKSGVSAHEIDSWIASQLAHHKMTSKTKGYRGYRHSSCISINDEVVHGVPSSKKIVQDGDLVKVDVCASWRGYCADMARAFFIGSAPQQAQKLVDVAYAALNKGIEQACVGNRVSDISAAIQKEVEKHGFGVVRDFAGHGIGKSMHEDPEVLNYGAPGKGPILRSGMTLAIEPMITAGNYAVKVMSDGWTVKTVDKSLAAHVEDTVLITDAGPKILTRHCIEGEKAV